MEAFDFASHIAIVILYSCWGRVSDKFEGMILPIGDLAQVPWYLNPALLPAVAGFVGVLTGGMIGAISSFVLDKKRDEREQAREELNRKREGRRAARMIDLEFEHAGACSSVAVENNKYWDASHVPLRLIEWDKHKAVIATELENDAWLSVRLAVDAIRNLNKYRELDANDPEAHPFLPAISSELAQSVADARDDIEKARVALSGFSYSG